MGERRQWSARDEQRIGEWLFLLLRFVITRDAIDLAAAESVARPLDAAALEATPSFTYFARTTRDICKAIAGPRDERAELILQRFVTQIEDKRLRDAFCACLELRDRSARRPRPRAAWRDRQDLWRGLPKR
jgi:hypothetical protein